MLFYKDTIKQGNINVSGGSGAGASGGNGFLEITKINKKVSQF